MNSSSPETYSHLFWGYAVIWGCIVVYLVLLLISQKRVARELDRLQATVGDGS